jgi:CRP-like cAMP-binding protein
METGRPYSRLLLRLERYNTFSASDRQRIADLPLKFANFVGGSDVVIDGDVPSQCTLVLDGFLYSYKLVAGSRRQITSFFVPGDIADFGTLFLPCTDYGIATLGHAVLGSMPHSALEKLLAASPALGIAFWRESLMQGPIFHEWVVNLGRRDAIARIAHIVCELAVRLQAVGLARNLTISVPWTQTDVADACGISNVHANRVIQELRHLGLVEWDSRRVKIRDWAGLVRLADFSGAYLRCREPAAIKKAPRPPGHEASEWA